jgi:phage host-nuclease inhibitor protein Gam
MKTRIKLTRPSLKSQGEMEATLGDIRMLTIRKNQVMLDRESAVKAIDERVGPALEELDRELKQKTDLVKTWAEGNAEAFGEKRSLETLHAVIGWRTGMPTLKTLAGWTWDRVLERLKVSLYHGYIRTKEEVDKQGILGDRQVLGDMLPKMGMRVHQEEAFFVEPKLEEVENRQVA